MLRTLPPADSTCENSLPAAAVDGRDDNVALASPSLLGRLSEIVLVNEIVGGAETAGYLLKYDSIHGTW